MEDWRLVVEDRHAIHLASASKFRPSISRTGNMLAHRLNIVADDVVAIHGCIAKLHAGGVPYPPLIEDQILGAGVHNNGGWHLTANADVLSFDRREVGQALLLVGLSSRIYVLYLHASDFLCLPRCFLLETRCCDTTEKLTVVVKHDDIRCANV
jgi:hypothetical protein